MDLLPIGTGQFAVLVALEESEKCQPLDVLDELKRRGDPLASAAFALLKRIMPADGLERRPRSWKRSLTGENEGIVQVTIFGYERLRLYLFMDGPSVIVLAGADLIEQGSSTQGLDHGRRVRQQYFSAKESGELQILPLDDGGLTGAYDVN